MSVLTYSVALLLIGAIIAVAFHEAVGLALAGIAVLGVLYSLLAYGGEPSGIQQDDIDRHVDDVLKHEPRL